MKKILILFLIILSHFFTISVLAEADGAARSKVQTNPKPEIIIYAGPSTDSILRKLTPNAELIPIFQQGDWLKMGDPTDGLIGWINLKEYYAARKTYFQPEIQTFYVHTTQNEKGKPSLNIVAYKNGRPLSQEEASKLYDQLRQEQAQQIQQMQRVFRSMEGIFGSYEGDVPWIQPKALLPAPKAQNTEQEINVNKDKSSS